MNNLKENDQWNNVIRRLSETEQELKREQEEKILIEMKMKQNELEHEQQMRNLINRYLEAFHLLFAFLVTRKKYKSQLQPLWGK